MTVVELQGALAPNLDETEKKKVLATWLLNSVKGGKSIINRYLSPSSSSATTIGSMKSTAGDGVESV